jgi:NADH-quinone oxidoreductase subunit N
VTEMLAVIAGRILAQTGPPATVPGAPLATGQQGSLHIPVEYHTILPELVLIGGALVILVVSSVMPKRSRRGVWAGLTVLVGVASLAASVWLWNQLDPKHPTLAVGGAVAVDGYSVFFMVLVSSAIIVVALAADGYLRGEHLDGPEFYVLALLSGSGAMIMAAANDLIVIFLGLEILSIALYVLAGYHRRRAESGEAAMKYFILGAFSSAIFLYGIALVYGATGSTRLDEIATFLSQNHLTNGVLMAGLALLLVGLGFKVAAVPFHTWTPDVYQGAPTPSTAFMAAVAKAAGFSGLIRILFSAFPTLATDWRPAIWVMAVLTLLVGSILAIVQTDIKRMLAYSSISHAGYVLVALQSASSKGRAAALFYLMSYTFMVLGSFTVVSLVGGTGEARNDVEAYRGLSSRRPGLALLLTTFLLAQAGVPFTSGFMAKFYVISAAVEQGQYVLAVIAMLSAAIAAFFYLRVTLMVYSPVEPQATSPVARAESVSVASSASTTASGPAQVEGGQAEGGQVEGGQGAVAVAARRATGRIVIPVGAGLALAICLVLTIGIGIVPAPLIGFAERAALLF